MKGHRIINYTGCDCCFKTDYFDGAELTQLFEKRDDVYLCNECREKGWDLAYIDDLESESMPDKSRRYLDKCKEEGRSYVLARIDEDGNLDAGSLLQ